MNETRYPLCWPAGWKRAQTRIRAQFGKLRDSGAPGSGYSSKGRLSIGDAMERIEAELRRFDVKEETVVISTNLPVNIYGAPRGDRGEPSDTGVAVYWLMKAKSQCMAIDTYDRVADNLAAVAATLEAMRAIERHGGASILDRAFIGFAALPASTSKPWREVFAITEHEHLNADALKTRYRALARQFHSDHGGNDQKMAELNGAYEEALKEIGA